MSTSRTRKTTIKDYLIFLHWDSKTLRYIAEVPDILTCSADGSTAAEALRNLEETFATLKAAYIEDRLVLPKPSPAGLTIETLRDLSPIMKIAALSKEAGVPYNRIVTKMRRSQELKPDESRALLQAMRKQGIDPIPKRAIGYFKNEPGDPFVIMANASPPSFGSAPRTDRTKGT